MTKGLPFTDREVAFVRSHMGEKFPSVIARALGQFYPEDNGGSRSPFSVSQLMKKLKEESKKAGSVSTSTIVPEPRIPPGTIKKKRRGSSTKTVKIIR